MSTSDLVVDAATTLARLYGKSYGALVASGQAAIELALELAFVGLGDEVVVPADGCHLVPAAVVRRGARPVFAALDDDLTMSLPAVVSKITERTRAVVAIHHLGLPTAVRAIRNAIPPSITVIEDASLAFGLMSGGDSVGSSADFVVTSFGPGKPLTLGGGGAVFGDQPLLATAMRRYGPEARGGDFAPRSFALHPCAVNQLSEAIDAATALVAHRRAVVATLRGLLKRTGFRVWTGREGDDPTWHRLPVWPSSDELFGAATAGVTWQAVGQLPYEVVLTDIPMFATVSTGKASGSSSPKPPVLLLRTDASDAIEAWCRSIPAEFVQS